MKRENKEKNLFVSGKKKFVKTLYRLGLKRQKDNDFSSLTEDLRRHFIDYVSDTADNRNSARMFTYGLSETDMGEPNEEQGILSSSGNLISDIIYAALGSKIPEEVIDEFPDIDQTEWDSVIRLSSLILDSLNWTLEDDSWYLENYGSFSDDFSELFELAEETLIKNGRDEKYKVCLEKLVSFMAKHSSRKTYFLRHFGFYIDEGGASFLVVKDCCDMLKWHRLREFIYVRAQQT